MATTSVGLRINSIPGSNLSPEDGIYLNGQIPYEDQQVQNRRLHPGGPASFQQGLIHKGEYDNIPTDIVGHRMVNNFYVVNMDELSAKPVSKLKHEIASKQNDVIVTNGGDSDVTLEYMDLDEFLHDNGLSNAYKISDTSGHLERAYPVSLEHRLSPTPPEDVQNTTNLPSPQSVITHMVPETCLPSRPHQLASNAGLPKQPSMMSSPTTTPTVSESNYSRRRSSSRSMDSIRSCSPEEYNSLTNAVKRGRKEMVPENDKDDKYWKRRAKNNLAAKRSRDSRRQREAQISMRTKFLESENNNLNEKLKQLQLQNEELKRRLAKYEQI